MDYMNLRAKFLTVINFLLHILNVASNDPTRVTAAVALRAPHNQ